MFYIRFLLPMLHVLCSI